MPDKTPTVAQTPESYLGYHYGLPNFDGPTITENKPAQYQFPASLPPDYLALAGTWTVNAEEITSGADARLELAFQANDVYLVLGGTGTIKATVGSHTRTIDVSGIPRLYTLVSSPDLRVRDHRPRRVPGRRSLRLHLRLNDDATKDQCP